MAEIRVDERETARWRLGVRSLAAVQAAVVLANLTSWPVPPLLTLLPVFALGLVVGVSRERAPGRWWFALAPLAAVTATLVALTGAVADDVAWWVVGAVVSAAPAWLVASTGRPLRATRSDPA
ncbi:hypothetical protein J1G42_13850 [Cellulomonas sp. zg-ZUI222]|uniref:hypothetical protein n=1 Tax=Cellulomonas wangleii TaxID=2816956 RepID=UPI001A93D22E|nr:hypothetical protein [Cellulomonas wangleii]MBO0921907.1 hypothetical protein [Cellulomonas wangleii]